MAITNNGHRPLTPEQLKNLFETIATNANTLRKLIAESASIAWSHDASLAIRLDAAESLVQSIGILADRQTGESIVGTVEDWLCGPLFTDQRKAVQ